MTPDELAAIVISAVVAGIVTAIGSSLLTVVALRVQIRYLERAEERHEQSLIRAHGRIDDMEKRLP